MKRREHPSPAFSMLAVLLFAAGCNKEAPKADERTASAAASAAPVAAAPAAGKGYLARESALVTFLIDAPVEQGRGKWTAVRGRIAIDPANIEKTTGHVDIDLDDLKTYTFDDPTKNAAQTEHAHNWLEIGKDVSADAREKNRWAIFTIQAVQDASAKRVADAPEKDGIRTVSLTAMGDLFLHGVHAPKAVKLAASFEGPPERPKSIMIRTLEPFPVSLSEHDVKPRDVVGKFLSGALEVVVKNKKIVDTAQVSIEKLELNPAE